MHESDLILTAHGDVEKPVDLDRANRWLTLFANLGVIAGLVFVGLEVQTNTESNTIAVRQAYSRNWLDINSAVMTNPQLSALIVKASSEDTLSDEERVRYRSFLQAQFSQMFGRLRLYDDGLVSEPDLLGAFGAMRVMAKNPNVRREIENIGLPERAANLIFCEEDKFQYWLEQPPDHVLGPRTQLSDGT